MGFTIPIGGVNLAKKNPFSFKPKLEKAKKSEIPEGLVSRGGGIYTTPPGPIDPWDKNHYPKSPYNGGPGFTWTPVGIEAAIIADNCAIGVQLTPVVGFTYLPTFTYVWKPPGDCSKEPPPPPPPPSSPSPTGTPSPIAGLAEQGEGIDDNANVVVVFKAQEIYVIGSEGIPASGLRCPSQEERSAYSEAYKKHLTAVYSRKFAYNPQALGISAENNAKWMNSYGNNKLVGISTNWESIVTAVIRRSDLQLIKVFRNSTASVLWEKTGSENEIDRFNIICDGDYYNTCFWYGRWGNIKLLAGAEGPAHNPYNWKKSGGKQLPSNYADPPYARNYPQMINLTCVGVLDLGKCDGASPSRKPPFIPDNYYRDRNPKDPEDPKKPKEPEDEMKCDCNQIIALLRQIDGKIGRQTKVTIYDEDENKQEAQGKNLDVPTLFEGVSVAVDRIEKISKIIGIDALPLTVPDSLITPINDNIFAAIWDWITPDGTRRITNLFEWNVWMLEQFSAHWGEWQFKIEIQDTDATQEGDQSKTIVIPNLAVYCRESMVQQIQLYKIMGLTLDVCLKALTESSSTKQEVVKTLLFVQEMAAFLDYQSDEKSVGVDVQITIPESGAPTEEQNDVHKFLQPSKTYVKYDDWNGKTSLVDMLQNIIKAINAVQ